MTDAPGPRARWLLTVSTDVDVDALAWGLAQLGAELSDDDAVPLDQWEQALGAIGPPDLPDRVRAAGLPVRKVSPDSDFTLF